MYNPQPDRSAEILANANNQAAAIQLEGMQSLGNSFAAMGNTFADSIAKSKENAAKAETNRGTAEAIASIYQTYGSPEQYQDFMTGLDRNSKNQDKLSGYNAVHVQVANSLLEMGRQQAQYNSALQLAQQKAALRGSGGGTSTTPTFSVDVDPNVDLGW
jgi:hypothetical protein